MKSSTSLNKGDDIGDRGDLKSVDLPNRAMYVFVLAFDGKHIHNRVHFKRGISYGR